MFPEFLDWTKFHLELVKLEDIFKTKQNKTKKVIMRTLSIIALKYFSMTNIILKNITLLNNNSIIRSLNIVAILAKNRDQKQMFLSIKLYIGLSHARSHFGSLQ